MQYTSITSDIIQVLVLLAVLTLLVKPFGGYMKKVYEGERTFLTPVFGPLERVLYRISGISPDAEMDWKQYAVTMLIFNFIGMVVTFAVLMLQRYLPLNPQKFPGFSWDLALNTAVSFATNTNWQAYSGESAVSYFSQVAGLSGAEFSFGCNRYGYPHCRYPRVCPSDSRDYRQFLGRPNEDCPLYSVADSFYRGT